MLPLSRALPLFRADRARILAGDRVRYSSGAARLRSATISPLTPSVPTPRRGIPPLPPRPRCAATVDAARRAYLTAFLGGARGPEAAAVILLAQQRLAPSTSSSYRTKWRLFEQFCTDHELLALPASSATVVQWVASLFLSGKVQPQSLQPYLSAVNDAHRAGGFDLPAHGDVLAAVRRGWAQRRASLQPEQLRLQRQPFPARHALAALRDITRRAASAVGVMPPTLWRALFFTAFGFQLMARADSDANLRVGDVIISVDALDIVLLHEKTRRHHLQRRVLHLEAADVPLLLLAARLWTDLRSRLFAAARLPPPPPTAPYWLLPGERKTSAAALCSSWLAAACGYLGVQPPPGGAWSSHSLRSGAASACHAVGVSLPSIRYWGGWAATSSVVNDYIDPTVRADEAAYVFFGWLLPRPPPGGGGNINNGGIITR